MWGMNSVPVEAECANPHAQVLCSPEPHMPTDIISPRLALDRHRPRRYTAANLISAGHRDTL